MIGTKETSCIHESSSALDDIVSKELGMIERLGIMDSYNALKELTAYLKSEGIPYFFSGNTASLFVLFRDGIINTNPLTPHYFCCKCNRIEFIDSVEDGYDLSDKRCSTCKEPMIKDGHSIYHDDETDDVKFFLAVSDVYFDSVCMFLSKMMIDKPLIDTNMSERRIGAITIQKHPIVPKWTVPNSIPLMSNQLYNSAMTKFLYEPQMIDTI